LLLKHFTKVTNYGIDCTITFEVTAGDKCWSVGLE